MQLFSIIWDNFTFFSSAFLHVLRYGHREGRKKNVSCAHCCLPLKMKLSLISCWLLFWKLLFFFSSVSSFPWGSLQSSSIRIFFLVFRENNLRHTLYQHTHYGPRTEIFYIFKFFLNTLTWNMEEMKCVVLTFKRFKRYGLAAQSTILCASKERPSAASVTSTRSPWHLRSWTADTKEVP